MPVGMLSTVDGREKLRQEKAAPASAYARRGRVAAWCAAAPVAGTPALTAAEQIQHFTEGGLCGPHPWRQPVTT